MRGQHAIVEAASPTTLHVAGAKAVLALLRHIMLVKWGAGGARRVLRAEGTLGGQRAGAAATRRPADRRRAGLHHHVGLRRAHRRLHHAHLR